MFALRHLFVSLIVFIQSWISFTLAVDGQTPIQFDAPALVAAHPAPCGESSASGHIVEIVVPVSTWLDARQRDTVVELQFEIGWISEPYPVVDYQPRTMLHSDVSGLINVEQQVEDGGRVQSSVVAPIKPVTVQGQVDWTKKQVFTSRMALVPKQDLLVASGTIQRGSGVFYRFHSSQQAAFEGGRELYFSVDVPNAWRGGLLQIVCRASGPKKSMWGATEWHHEQVEFAVPVYLQGDEAAHQAARAFASAERQWREQWLAWSSKPGTSTTPTSWAWWTVPAHDAPDRGGMDFWNTPLSGRKPCAPAPNLPTELRLAATELATARAAMHRLSAAATGENTEANAPRR